MKTALSFIAALLAFNANAADIATVMGAPDPTLDFTQSIVKEQFQFIAGPAETEITTQIYSVLARRNVRSAASIEVIDSTYRINAAMLGQALDLASSFAPVILTNLGPMTEALCATMANQARAAYVVVAGNDASDFGLGSRPSCGADNILIVTAFNQVAGDLEGFANFGLPVRLASPSHLIRAIGPGDVMVKRTNASMGAALTAAQLAEYARSHSERGAALVQSFLRDRTVNVPALNSKVAGGLALDDTGF